jgi:hypothetical protein
MKKNLSKPPKIEFLNLGNVGSGGLGYTEKSSQWSGWVWTRKLLRTAPSRYITKFLARLRSDNR